MIFFMFFLLHGQHFVLVVAASCNCKALGCFLIKSPLPHILLIGINELPTVAHEEQESHLLIMPGVFFFLRDFMNFRGRPSLSFIMF